MEGLSARDWRRQTANGELDFRPGALRPLYRLTWWSTSSSGTRSICACPRILLRAVLHARRRCGNGKSRRAPFRGLTCGTLPGCPSALMTNRLGATDPGASLRRGHIQPSAFFTAPSTAQTLPHVATKGLAACYCTHMNLVEKRGTVDANVNIFPLYDQGVPLVQKLSLLRHKQRYLTHFAKYFMDLTFQVAASIEKTPVRWIVQQPAVEKSVENV